MRKEMKKIISWFGYHRKLKFLLFLLILIVAAWILGQLAGPELIKAIFL